MGRMVGYLSLLWFAGATVCAAQGLDGARAGVSRAATSDSSALSDESEARGARLWLPRPHFPPLSVAEKRNVAPIASAVIPGSGQFLLGQNRAVAFLAVEALMWWRYSADIRDRSAQEERYKDVARRVARAQFAVTPPDSDWTYYEQMRDFKESGQFSLSPAGPVVPETDASTFNGNRWLLALSTSRDSAEALAEYERTAVKPEFRWSWGNAGLQFDIFKRYTDKRNDAARAAVRDLAVIALNHVVSMVDAFATMRLQVRAEADGRTSIGARLSW
jgi:hypothetical protein